MKALVFDGSLRFDANRAKASPAEGDVLVQVSLAGICATDLEIVNGYSGFRGVPGHEFVGIVAQGSADLLGRRVVAEINCVCGRCDMCTSGLAKHCRRRSVIGIVGRDGTFAEFVAVPRRNCHVLPDSISDEEAVFVEPLAAAIQITQQLRFEPRMRVAVLGSGRLGLLVAQVLAGTGCGPTVIGRNPRTLELADRKGIRSQLVGEIRRHNEFDVVVDCTGSVEGLPIALNLVRPRGTIVMKTTCASKLTLDASPIVVNEVSLVGSRCGPFPDAISALLRHQVDVASLITRRYPVSRGVDAFEDARSPETLKVLLDPRA